MRKFALPVMMMATTFLVLPTVSAQAQATRTWVSGVGDDANPCSRTAPCKTFAGAISKTATNGEISVLDPGGFGAVTITKSITINGEGTLAGILNAGTNGVIVSSTIPAGSKVVLRHLSIAGGGTGLNGIRHLGPAELVVDNVRINGQTSIGIDMTLTGISAQLQVTDSLISGTAIGIGGSTTAGTAHISITNTRLYGLSNSAVTAGANAVVSVRESVISKNNNGIFSASSGVITVSNSELFANTTAFNSGVGSTILISNNEIYANTTNFILGGTIQSATNNRVSGGGAANPNGAAITIK
jgi:hypothetical protein